MRMASPQPHLFKLVEPQTITGSDPYTMPETPTRKCITNEADQGDLSPFSSITSLANIPQEGKYIHPLLKRSCSSMSEKSLELCTESLGCETGSGIIEKNCFSSSDSVEEFEIKSLSEIGKGESKNASLQKKSKCKEEFPPPLSSIAGGSCIQVRPRREDGRLVIKTITIPSSRSCFQAERREGRLLLRYLNINTPALNMEEAQEEKDKQEEEYENYNEVRGCGNVEGVVNGIENDVGGEMVSGKIQRPGRCSEGGNGNKGRMLVLESFWVASS